MFSDVGYDVFRTCPSCGVLTLIRMAKDEHNPVVYIPTFGALCENSYIWMPKLIFFSMTSSLKVPEKQEKNLAPVSVFRIKGF